MSEADGGETGLAELGAGETVGEMAVPSAERRSATVSESEGIIREMRTGFADSFDDMTLPCLSFKRASKASRFIRLSGSRRHRGAAGFQASRERLREWLATASERLRARRPDLFA